MSQCTGSYTGDFGVTLEKIYARDRFPTIHPFDVTTTVEKIAPGITYGGKQEMTSKAEKVLHAISAGNSPVLTLAAFEFKSEAEFADAVLELLIESRSVTRTRWCPNATACCSPSGCPVGQCQLWAVVDGRIVYRDSA